MSETAAEAFERRFKQDAEDAPEGKPMSKEEFNAWMFERAQDPAYLRRLKEIRVEDD